MVRIGIMGNGAKITSTISKLVRCRECEYLHENGNCLKVGGFFSSVSDKDCPKEKDEILGGGE